MSNKKEAQQKKDEQGLLELGDLGVCPSCGERTSTENLFHLGECMTCFLKGVGAIE